jgi:hypothetical protein
VDLADGGGGQGGLVEPEIDLPGPAQLLLNDAPNLGKGKGGNIVLEAGEFLDEIDGNEIGAGSRESVRA